VLQSPLYQDVCQITKSDMCVCVIITFIKISSKSSSLKLEWKDPKIQVILHYHRRFWLPFYTSGLGISYQVVSELW